MPSPKIAIIGAGPSGLTLASLLHKSPSFPTPNITIFDLRPRPTASSLSTPSGSLDLHASSGQLALAKCGLLEQFKSLVSDCSEEMIISDAGGVVRYHDQGHGGDRPEISRNALTGLLLSSVPEEVIKWETKVLSVVRSSSSSGKKWNITSSSSSRKINSTSSTEASAEAEEEMHEFDLVIGADGAWSKSRASLPGTTTPFYSGVSAITLTVTNLRTHAPLNSLLGHGTFWACAPRRTLMTHHGSHDSARIYLMLASPSETYLQDKGLTGLTGADLATKLLDHESPKPEPNPEPESKPELESELLFQDFSKNIKDLITTACLSEPSIIDAKPLYMLPPSNTWTHTPGLTLIGDAAHLMTPFAGEGVNCAMLDALELSKAIISTSTSTASNQITDDLDKAMEVFEIRMWRRTRGIAEDTYRNLKMIFEDERVPEGIVKDFESHGGVVDMVTMGFGFLRGKINEVLGYD